MSLVHTSLHNFSARDPVFVLSRHPLRATSELLTLNPSKTHIPRMNSSIYDPLLRTSPRLFPPVLSHLNALAHISQNHSSELLTKTNHADPSPRPRKHTASCPRLTPASYTRALLNKLPFIPARDVSTQFNPVASHHPRPLPATSASSPLSATPYNSPLSASVPRARAQQL